MSAQTCLHCCMKLENISVRVHNTFVLEGINIHVNCGELLAVVGPNGAGKTTLLKAILQTIPYSGTMRFQVKGAVKKKPRIGYVPQKINFDADSPITVQDYLSASCWSAPVWLGTKNKVLNKVLGMLKTVSAQHLINRKLADLSGGELQRVLLALAIYPVPDILLLDEPISGVDIEGLSRFYEIVSNLRKELDVSIILVTHDLGGIGRYCDRMVLINRTVLAQGTPRELFANEKLLETFGPRLWNITCLPDVHTLGSLGEQ